MSDQSRMSMKAGNKGALSRFLALEPRVLLDAAAVETAAKVADAASPDVIPNSSDSSLEALSAAFTGNVIGNTASAAGGASEVLFVDAGIDNYAALISGLGSNVEVHVLEGGDWALQIQAALGRREGDVSAIHLVSHGAAGRLEIGGSTVDADSLDAYSRVWSVMKQALSAEGDILVYGCNVGEGDKGLDFVQALSERTGADVAASEDLTGLAALGGDWDLEIGVGKVESSALYSQEKTAFTGLLADGWVQDTEIGSTTPGNSASTGVAITRTTDGKDWKFVARPAANAVDVYVRDSATTTGVWAFSTTITNGTSYTGTGSGQFGFDIAAAGQKLAVAAPTFNVDFGGVGANDGRVYVFTYNGTNWITTPELLSDRVAPGSGQTGFNNGPTDNNLSYGGNDQFGYSIDLATDGAGNYRLIVGNPYEDWREYDDDDNDGAAYGSDVTRNVQDDAGVAWVFQSNSGNHANFTDTALTTLVSRVAGGTTGNGHLFGGVVGVGYDYDNGKWWYAAGGDGLNEVRLFGGITTGATYVQSVTWDSAGNNDVSMDDDYMVVANASAVQAYKVDAGSTTWSTLGAAFGAGGAVVYIDDMDQTAAGDGAVYGNAQLVYSGTISGNPYTYVAQLDASGVFVNPALINTRQEIGVALDRYRGMDVIVANGSGAQSWHYNWGPLAVADTASVSEDSSVTVNVIANDSDQNITGYGTIFGDSLTVSAVGSSQYGATITFAGGNVTYNASTSSYFQTLALGQTVQDVIQVTIQDGQGGTAIKALTVTITGANDAPTVSSVTALSPLRVQQAGTTASYDLSAFFTDIDQGEAGSLEPDISSIVFPSGWAVSKNGALLLVTIPAGAANNSNGTITLRMQDPNGALSGTRSFVINVDAVNDAPVVQNPIMDQVALSQYSFSFVVPENSFFDADPSPFDVLTYSATLSSGAALPSWLTFDPATRQFSGTPAAGDTGTLSVRVAVSDGVASVYDDFSITVVNPSVHATGQFADGASASADFGFSMAISNNGLWMVVGSPGLNSSRGAVYVYEWTGSSWTQRAGTIQSSDGVAGDKFGYSVAISDDGSKIVVGARGDDGGMGSAYCYSRTGTGTSTAYGSEGKLQAATRLADDFFGTSVAINESGSYVLIGASHYNANGLTDSGAAFMTGFTTTGTSSVSGMITPKDAAAYDRFGTSVAFDQNILVVSALADDNPSGMVSRIPFDDSDGTTASASFGSTTATLGAGAQFYYDATRGEVLKLTGTSGGATLSSPVDLGASWTISSWYSMGSTDSSSYRTLTRGSSDHQIIINSGTNNLGVWNNSGVGASGFVAANTSEQQFLIVNSGSGFTITIPGVGTTAPITYSAAAATLATSVASAMNALMGAGTVTVAAVTDGTSDTLRITFNNGRNYDLLTTNQAGNTATREQQTLAFTTTGDFTITVPGGGTTATITYNATAATLATNIQTALNNLLGSGAATVSVITDTTSGSVQNDTVRIVFNNGTYDAVTVSKTGTTITKTTAANSPYALTSAQLSGWHNIVAVGEGSGVNAHTSYYIDGVKVGTAYYKPTDDVMIVGNYQGGGQRFADYIDDFRTYDRALTASEIRNIYQGATTTAASYSDAGSIYVFSTDMANSQVAKLYVPDAFNGDMLGWAVDVDIYDAGGTRQSGVIVASSIYNDAAANEGGAVYVWRSSSLQSGGLNNGGGGNGTWQLETKLTSFDASPNTYFGNDVAVDYDESTGGTRLVVGAPFENANGSYSGAVYSYKYQAGVWLPEKFVDSSPQGGSISSAAFFGNAVDVAGTRAVFGSRWRDTGGQTNDGAAYSVELLTQGSYATVMSVETSAMSSFALSDEASLAAFALDTSTTQGTVSYDDSGRLVYSAGDAFSTLSLGETATDSFTYFTEQGGVTYANLVQITVYGTASEPAVFSAAKDDVVSVSAVGSALIDVLANDTAAAGSLVLSAVQADGVLGALIIENGKLRYDPQGAFDNLRAGEAAQQVFTYSAVDQYGNTVTGHVTLVIEGVDDLVVATADAASVNANASVTVDVLANDSDRDGNGTFWVSALDASAAKGSFTYNGDGTITYVPGDAFRDLPVGQTATDRIVYTVRDSTGHEYSAMLTITVIGTSSGSGGGNGLPHPGNDVAVTSGMNAVVIPVAENDGGGQITGIDVPATKGTVAVLADGSMQYTPGPDLAMLSAGAVFVDTFTYTVRYADGRTEQAIVTVHVNGEYIASRLAEEEEDRAYFATFTRTASVLSAGSTLATMEPASAPVDAAASDPVAEMALDALVEMTALDQTVSPEESAAPAAPAATEEVVVNAQGKPALSVMLMQERAARHADISALLRHLA